jgi:membrane associated rhomboid family serine protease
MAASVWMRRALQRVAPAALRAATQVAPAALHPAWACTQLRGLNTRARPAATAAFFMHASTAIALATGCVSATESGEDVSTSHAATDATEALGIGLRLTCASSAAESDDRYDAARQRLRIFADKYSDGRLAYAVQRVTEMREGAAAGIERRLQTREGRTVLGFIGANIAVYCAWKVLPSAFMVRHFTSSLEAMRRGRVWTALMANLSHMGIFHLAANMYLLDMFGHEVAAIITPERFVVLYIAGGLASVMASLAARRVMRNNVLSLGASGSVMAVITAFTCLFPNRELSILNTWTLPATDALALWALCDACGLLGSFGKVDFGAHLGGLAFSFGYYNLIREQLADEWAKKRELERRRSWWLWAGRGSDE